ncbi:MAG: hypothetical protein DCC68_20320 [Planctomycetota bacterium]|nr:MAG: hypothetical protein DCC68_20320 [Planctomycetota bacterium]
MNVLEHISTHWHSINEPARFVMRYAAAIRAYLCAFVGNEHDADEVAQEFLLRSLYRNFDQYQIARGRFRDYLRAVVRNAAIDYLRRRKMPQASELDMENLADRGESDWTAAWRACTLERVWQQLDEHQRNTPGNLYFTVLKTAVDHDDEDSPHLAARVSQQSGREFKPDAFRQQLSRARRKFAELLIAEISQTLCDQSDGEVRDELAELGLLPYVEDLL